MIISGTISFVLHHLTFTMQIKFAMLKKKINCNIWSEAELSTLRAASLHLHLRGTIPSNRACSSPTPAIAAGARGFG